MTTTIYTEKYINFDVDLRLTTTIYTEKYINFDVDLRLLRFYSNLDLIKKLLYINMLNEFQQFFEIFNNHFSQKLMKFCEIHESVRSNFEKRYMGKLKKKKLKD